MADGGRALLEDLGRVVARARALRYENPATFDDVTVDDLERASRSLRAISYSCGEGARFLDRIRALRSRAGNPVVSPAIESAEETE